MVNIPGTQLLSNNFLGFIYLIFLLYLFLGISIVADIFMEAIEEITSASEIIIITDPDTGEDMEMEIFVWNATMANLTLMAFGSSAPEILLSCSDALQTLGKPASHLGAATIVGSAAFNLMVISAVSVYAVGDVPKKIDDLGVFATTGFFSVFAYMWMTYVLAYSSKDEITRTEAWLTLSFMLILLIVAYFFDKVNQSKRTATENEDKKVQNENKMAKTKLRSYARDRGDEVIIHVGQGINTSETNQITEKDKK